MDDVNGGGILYGAYSLLAGSAVRSPEAFSSSVFPILGLGNSIARDQVSAYAPTLDGDVTRMSTVDNLKCDMPLPEPQLPQDTIFQTRDTDARWGEGYTITADGRLLHHTVRHEVVLESERPSGMTEGLRKLPGSLRDVPTGDVEITFNGGLEFFGRGRDRVRYTYFACFIDGRCVRALIDADYKKLMEEARRWALTRDLP